MRRLILREPPGWGADLAQYRRQGLTIADLPRPMQRVAGLSSRVDAQEVVNGGGNFRRPERVGGINLRRAFKLAPDLLLRVRLQVPDVLR